MSFVMIQLGNTNLLCKKEGECLLPYDKKHMPITDPQHRIFIDNKRVEIGRYMVEKMGVPLNNSLKVVRTCSNPACINPKHLKVENKINAVKHRYDLSKDQIVDIFLDRQRPLKDTAKLYNIPTHVVSLIRSGKIYPAITEGLTTSRGKRKPNLSKEAIEDIVSSKERGNVLADRYGVHVMTIYSIRKKYKKEEN